MRRITVWLPLVICILTRLAVVPAIGGTSTEATLTVLVRAGSSGKPISTFTLAVDGAVQSCDFARDGTCAVSHLRAGLRNVRVIARGFAPKTVSAALEPGSNRLEIAVDALKGLATIGTVRARQEPGLRVLDESTNSSSASSLLDAINKSANVSVVNDSNDSNAKTAIATRNRDAGQTAILIDGAKIATTGSSLNLASIGIDLFSAADITANPNVNSLGGSVDFLTSKPSRTLTTALRGFVGPYDQVLFSARASDSVGRLGFAVQHALRTSNKPMTFQVYEDTSGLTYAHDGEQRQEGDLVKIAYAVSPKLSLGAARLVNNTYDGKVCTRYTTLLPCGYGPENTERERYTFHYVSTAMATGRWLFELKAYRSADTDLESQPSRTLALTVYPLVGQLTTTTNGLIGTASIFSGHHHIEVKEQSLISSVQYSAGTSAPFQSSSGMRAFKQLAELDDTLTIGQREYGGTVAFSNISGSGPSLLGNLKMVTHRGDNRFEVSVGLGSAEMPQLLAPAYSDPAYSFFDCSAGTTFVQGPGDRPTPQSAVNAQMSYQSTKIGSPFSVTAYYQYQSGQSIVLRNPAAGTLDPSYVGALAQLWRAPTICGRLPFDAQKIYVNQIVSGTTRLYEGLELNRSFALGKAVTIASQFSYSVARLVSADERFADPFSTTIVGRQLPGKPLTSGSIQIAWKTKRQRISADAQYVGGGNARRLGPYIVANGGIFHSIGRGSELGLTGSNLLNTYAGNFSSDACSQPLPSVGAGAIRYFAFPLAPRAVFLKYGVTLGQVASSR